MLGINARDLSTFRRLTGGRSSYSCSRAPRDSVVVAESGIAFTSTGRSSGARRSGCDPRRIDADASADLGARARRAALAVARQGVRADSLGRRRRRGRRRRGSGWFRSGTRGALAARAACSRFPRTMLSVAVHVGRARRRRRLISFQLYQRETGKVRGRDAVLLRDGLEVARVLDLSWDITGPQTT